MTGHLAPACWMSLGFIASRVASCCCSRTPLQPLPLTLGHACILLLPCRVIYVRNLPFSISSEEVSTIDYASAANSAPGFLLKMAAPGQCLPSPAWLAYAASKLSECMLCQIMNSRHEAACVSSSTAHHARVSVLTAAGVAAHTFVSTAAVAGQHRYCSSLSHTSSIRPHPEVCLLEAVVA